MFNVWYLHSYRYRDALRCKRKGLLCVGVSSITVEQDCAACIYEGVIKTVAIADLDMAQKKSKRKVVCVGDEDLDDQKRQKRRSSVFVTNLARPKEIVMKNISVSPDSTDNSMAHPEETIDNETLQATSCSGHNVRGQAKAQTELTCAVSQAERILNMCEIGYEVHISKNFSFKFERIILI